MSKEERESAPVLASLEGAFGESDLGELQRNKEIVVLSLRTLDALASNLENRIGSVNAPDLSKLNEVLKEIDNLLGRQLAGRVRVDASTPASASADSSPVLGEPGRSARRFGAVSEWVANLRRTVTENPREEEGSGAQERRQSEQPASLADGRSTDMVESRRDVLRLLDQVCRYYEEFEPASPVPLLLKRAMRLVEMNFLEIIQDMAPESLARIQALSGATEEKQ